MKSKQTIRVFFLMLALIMGVASEAWALGQSDIVIDPTIDNTQGSVEFKSVAEDGRTVTITVTPTSSYYLKENADIIVYKLISPSSAPTRSSEIGFPIADRLVVTGPVENTTNDYQFVIPEGYAGAWVSVSFTAKAVATAGVTAKDLTYTSEPQALVTLDGVSGGSGEGCVTYSLTEGGDYTIDIPTGTNSGTYTVYYKVNPDGAHSEGSGSVDVTINKAQLTSVTLNESVIAEGHTVQVNKVYAGNLEVSTSDYTLSGNEATDEGNYTVTVTAKPDVDDPPYHNNFTGSVNANYRIVADGVFRIPDDVTTDVKPSDLNGHYVLTADVNASVFAGLYSTESVEKIFTGTLEGEAKADGTLPKITGLTHALFDKIDGGTVKNIVLENVNIPSGTNVGAIANEMTGTSTKKASIYNCGILSGSVSGSEYVGGLVGQLGLPGNDGKDKCYARVINCFSYANVSGRKDVGGIVGYNSYSSKHNDIRTMVMNCMFYGDITDIPESGMNVSPIYGGYIINNANKDNADKGLNNYNYYLYESNYSKNNKITSDKYNCALAAEERYLVRFEFYRLLLNSNRKLAAYYATGSADNANQMAKWVLETADRSITNPKPYPILKQQAKYYSIINYDDDHVTDLTSSLVNGKPTEQDRNKGGKLASLRVSIEDNTSGKGSRTGSFITTASKTLPITDKDFDKYNYNYYKVRLPYYNEVGKDNYKDGKVVTGWIITGMTGATPTKASVGEDITTTDEGTTIPYNFADRTCTKFDNDDYRVFSQGAYFDVPIGVTAITIKPYWANAAFLSDKYLDRTYNSSFGGGADVTGEQYTDSDTPYEINGISIKVRNTFAKALEDITTKGSTVYDNAIVLVGNYHQSGVPYNDKTTPFTIMSADFDNDNEPDFSLVYQHTNRLEVAPIRFDFISILGTSMAQKPNGSANMNGVGIFKPYGWFEVTNTALIHFGQFEYDFNSKQPAPLILLGGEVDQIVSNNSGEGLANTSHTQYIHVGSNVWFKEFQNGTHADKTSPTPHRPISVTGGEYKKFYLSGMYQPNATKIDDNAECYINGGKFGEVAGAGQEQIKGDVTWIIDYADIDTFYGGGINAANAITGDINVTIENSHVDVYCGGPKFGNMTGYNTESTTDDKTVTTNAEDCVFRRYFGAGYGGASYNRVRTRNVEKNHPWDTWQGDYTNNIGKYIQNNKGIATGFEYEYFIGSAGTVWGRFYVNYASFSKAITNNVYSNLTGCHVTGDFYGGGSLGVVYGTAYSILDGCTVDGSVFGGGYSASVPTVDVVSSGFSTYPSYNSKAGIFTLGINSDSVSYTWDYVQTLSNNKVYITPSPPSTTSTSNIIKTDQVLTNLGQVNNVDLTITGSTYVKGDLHTYDEDGKIISAETETEKGGVFGGGDSSAVNGNTVVKIEETSTTGAKVGVMNVYGGGNSAPVGGNASVTLKGNSLVRGDVFGGGNEGIVTGNATVTIGEE